MAKRPGIPFKPCFCANFSASSKMTAFFFAAARRASRSAVSLARSALGSMDPAYRTDGPVLKPIVTCPWRRAREPQRCSWALPGPAFGSQRRARQAAVGKDAIQDLLLHLISVGVRPSAVSQYKL